MSYRAVTLSLERLEPESSTFAYRQALPSVSLGMTNDTLIGSLLNFWASIVSLEWVKIGKYSY